MSDEECVDLFDAEPAFGTSQPVERISNFSGFGKTQIGADTHVLLPAELWMSIFVLLSADPHQVWWRILAEVSKHINYALKLYFNRIKFSRYPSSATVAQDLAAEGFLSCLQYAHENGAKLNLETCLKAAQNGHLNCLKYAHENACEWNELVCYFSAANGQLECLKYAHEHGCDWTRITIYAALENDHLECFKYAYVNGCPSEQQDSWRGEISLMSTVASNGSLSCLKYLREQGEPWEERLLVQIVRNGHLDCLKYAMQDGCPYDPSSICADAADDLECLKYLYESGFPWGKASSQAASRGNIECLKYIHEHSGAWIGDEIELAFRLGSLECLKYAFEHGCPVPADLCAHRRYYTSRDKIDYAHTKVECTCPAYYHDNFDVE